MFSLNSLLGSKSLGLLPRFNVQACRNVWIYQGIKMPKPSSWSPPVLKAIAENRQPGPFRTLDFINNDPKQSSLRDVLNNHNLNDDNGHSDNTLFKFTGDPSKAKYLRVTLKRSLIGMHRKKHLEQLARTMSLHRLHQHAYHRITAPVINRLAKLIPLIDVKYVQGLPTGKTGLEKIEFQAFCSCFFLRVCLYRKEGRREWCYL